MEFWIKAAQLLASLSILIVLHELGHFIPAKYFKTRVEKFYLFFDPWFSLFKVKKGETEYGIGWLPLGGYVKISGMIDESMDKEQMKKPAEPWEFRAKPAWQRLIIMVGGVTVNLILGMLIYAMTLFVYGEKYLPNDNITDGLWVMDSLAMEMGFENGDKIVSINNQKVANYSDIMPEMIYAKEVKVIRNGEEKNIAIPENFVEQLIDNKGKVLFYPRVPTIIDNVPDSSHNKGIDLQSKDKVVAINGHPIKYHDQFKDTLLNYKNQEVNLTIDRKGETVNLDNVKVSDDGLIGVVTAFYTPKQIRKAGLYQYDVKEFGFFEAFPAGINKAIDKLTFYVRQFKLILNPSTGAYKGVGGFGAIGNLFPATWEWEAFWEITAFLSLMLAFMNILPIPALDGGHVLFLLYEIVARRKPNEKFMEYAQMAGMIILLGLLIFANGNDILRLFGK